MANEPTLRPGDQSIDGWVEYLQTQLKLLGGGIINIPDTYQPNGVFDDETERYVHAFQHYHHIQADGIVGDETWNMLPATSTRSTPMATDVNRTPTSSRLREWSGRTTGTTT